MAAVVVLLVTLLPISHNPHWLVRGADFPRLQIAILAAVIIFTALLSFDFVSAWHWLIVQVAGFCVIWQLWWIFPYTRFSASEVRPSEASDALGEISLLTSNVLTSNRNADALLALVAQYQPDVLVTLESDQWWQDRLDVLEKNMPHTMKCPLDNLYGMHVYSKLELDQSEIEFLVEESVPSMHTLLKLRNGQWVRLHFLHPAPPSPTENEESSERDAELLVVGKSVSDCELPVIITGDLNDVAWSATTRLFRKLSGLLDPRVGRGMFNTFHAGIPVLRWPLDHVFHSAHFRLSVIERLPTIGSDHFPLFVRLSFEPDNTRGEVGPSSDAPSLDRVDSIIREKAVSAADVPVPEK